MAQSVYHLFRDTVQSRSQRTAAQYKEDGEWKSQTWGEFAAISDRASAGLVALGIEPKDRVSIMATTALEWAHADMGILGAGATTVPIYHSSTEEDAEYILNNSGARLVIVDENAQAEKIRAIRSQIPNVIKLIVMEAGAAKEDDWEMSWETFLKTGEEKLGEVSDIVDQRASGLTADDVLTLIYTSGTTGVPKGTVLTHDCMLYEAEAINKVGIIHGEDVQYMFLPLAHVFAKVMEVAWIGTGHVMAFWEGDQKKIVDNLAEVRPTMMAAVPRIYEKVHASVVSKIEARTGIGGAIAKWGIAKGEEVGRRMLAGEKVDDFSWKLAKKLVFSKVGAQLHERFGGRLRFFISGGAPLGRDLGAFFQQVGVTICEGYGLTETSAATCVNLPSNIKLGTVGVPLPGTQVRIADDGEILIKGRGVMKGYWKMPEETAKAIDEDGWFYTGDIGEIDQDGFVRITDRKKDIIITAGGKNVAPQKIENALKSKSPLISQVIVHGDKRKYLSALLTVDPDALESWANEKKISSGAFDYSVVSQKQEVRAEVQRVVDLVNEDLARFETIKKFSILDHDFEIGDQLTPKLSVKRKHCNEKYKSIFDGMYDA